MINNRIIDHVYSKKTIVQLTSTSLRIIAMVTMFIDHFAFIIIKNGILYGYDDMTYKAAIATTTGLGWYSFYVICRMIGRISFPIFCFLLVEGILRSKNLLKYVLRLFTIMFISEIPYNLMYSARLFDLNHQNVIVGLLISALMLIGIEKTYKHPLLQTIIIVASVVIAHFSRCDYGYKGVLLTLIIYFCRTERNYRTILITILMFIFTFNWRNNGSLQLYGFGALAGPIIHMYNGKKGLDLIPRRIYYLFYPAHILFLFLIIFLTYPR